MKKLATWVLAIVFTLSFALPQGTAFANDNAVKLVVDGVEVGGYEQAFVSHEQVLIPVKELFTEAGYIVTDDAKGKVSATNTYLTVDFKASAGTIEKNGKKVDTEFPLTLQGGGNYITSDFLATLEGFDVEVSEDKKTVNVTTNRVDVAAFLAKTATLDLNSSSLNVSLAELATATSLGNIELKTIKEPKSSYKNIAFPSVDAEGKVTVEGFEEYSTTEGDYKKFGDVWVKLAAPVTTVEATKLVPAEKVDATKEEATTEETKEATEVVAPAVPLQLDSLATLALLQKYTKGINIFEYKDAYVMTQTLTSTEAAELKVTLTELLSGEVKAETTVEATELVPAEEVEATKEEATKVEATKVESTKVEATEEEATKVEATEEEATEEEATEEEATEEEATEEEATEEAKTVRVVITFNNFNSVKAITVPADVIKNAISEEDYKAQLAEAAKKAEEAKK